MSRVYKSTKINIDEKKIITNPTLEDYNMMFEIEENNENYLNDSYFDVDDQEVQQESNLIIIKAQEEAARIVQQARKQAEEIAGLEKLKIDEWWEQKRLEDVAIVEKEKKDGYNVGYNDGKKIAENDIKLQYQSILEKAQTILKKSYEIKEEIIKESELPIVELSISIAEKIIKKEIEIDKNIVSLIVKEALKAITDFEKISIYVNPNNFEYLHNMREELLKGLNGQVELMIFPDSLISDDGCIIKTLSGTLDAKIDTQLEEIKKNIIDIASRRNE
ncbi:MAG: FliH/SctL family protein [Vulcanibacillus sp.]